MTKTVLSTFWHVVFENLFLYKRVYPEHFIFIARSGIRAFHSHKIVKVSLPTFKITSGTHNVLTLQCSH